MKKLLTLLACLFVLSVCMFVASACSLGGTSEISAEKGDKGDQGEQGIQGEKGDKGDPGQNGQDGRGIEKAEINADGELIITYTDGISVNLGKIADKTEHSFGEWMAFTSDDTSCENRLFFRVCTDCRSIEWKQGSYTDHNFTTVTTQPTCQAQGYDTKTCGICGKVETINYTDKADHVWGDTYTLDGIYHWFDCITCDEIKNKEKHSVNTSGECSVCHELIPTDGILYEIVDGKARVVGYEGTSSLVRIAETYNGTPVTEISRRAFYDCDTLISLVIPNSVASISVEAIASCDNLTELTLPFIGEDRDAIGYKAVLGYIFGYFTNNEYKMKGVTCQYSEQTLPITYYHYYIPKTLCRINFTGEIITEGAFKNCINLTEIKMLNSLIEIGSYAFDNCASLTSIEIPDSVTTIGDHAFYDCASLTNIEIPDSVTSIGYSVFNSCANLENTVIGDGVGIPNLHPLKNNGVF